MSNALVRKYSRNDKRTPVFLEESIEELFISVIPAEPKKPPAPKPVFKKKVRPVVKKPTTLPTPTFSKEYKKKQRRLSFIYDIQHKKTALTKREIIYRRDGFMCLCCQEKDVDLLTIDHVVPTSKGGVNSSGNLQTLCKKCNGKKGDRIRDYRIKA